MKQPMIILTGPTAVGKTALSIELAKAVGGEIISADSMQVYRHMDIGSAKIREEEMCGVKHHLIDVLEPTQEFNVVAFQTMAKEALKQIYGASHIPIVTGGTGFYIQALLYEIDIKEDDSGSQVRSELELLAQKEGAGYMHELLASFDPESAANIHPNNQKRVIRAIEYYRLTGERMSLHNETEKGKESPYRFLYYVINTDREKLYEQIDRRVDLMMEEGLVEEVKKLSAMGLTREMVSMQGLGYKEILDYLGGQMSLEEAVYVLKRDTRHFAKRQLTWFKRERDVRWLNLPEYGYDRRKVLEKILDDVENERWS